MNKKSVNQRKRDFKRKFLRGNKYLTDSELVEHYKTASEVEKILRGLIVIAALFCVLTCVFCTNRKMFLTYLIVAVLLGSVYALIYKAKKQILKDLFWFGLKNKMEMHEIVNVWTAYSRKKLDISELYFTQGEITGLYRLEYKLTKFPELKNAIELGKNLDYLHKYITII